jgi:hypothetical protein
MIFRCRQANHRGALHRDREETRKDPFHRGPLIIKESKSPRSVGNLITNGGVQTDEVVTAFLVEELWM